MVACKCRIVVTAGVVPSMRADEYTQSWEWCINSSEGIKREGNMLYTPGELRTNEELLMYKILCNEASNYARQLQNPSYVNWVRLEWIWL